MIPNDPVLRSQMIKRMINGIITDVDNAMKELSEWEQNFISSIQDQFTKKGELSNKQCEILERIYDK